MLVTALTMSAVSGLGRAEEIPEIRRIHVPSDRIGSFFPVGTPVRMLSRAQLDRVVEEARGAARERAALRMPRVLQALHHARLDGTTLRGDTTLVVDPGSNVPCALPVEPWSQAVRGAADRTDVRTDSGGRLFAWLTAPGQQSLDYGWSLDLEMAEREPSIALGLPIAPLARLELDLPPGFSPEIAGTERQGPRGGDSAAREVWRFENAKGALVLTLRSTAASGSRSTVLAALYHGRTQINLLEDGPTWEASWELELATRSAQALSLEADPRVVITDVSGPAVLSVSSAGNHAGSSRFDVHLSEIPSGQTSIRIRARLRRPEIGPWEVPTVRLGGGFLTGMRTTVLVSPAFGLAEVEEREGSRVPPREEVRRNLTLGATLLCFESRGTGPVAELSLAAPAADASASVSGQVTLEPDAAPRAEAVVEWTIRRGEALVLPLALTRGWVPERVQIIGLDESTTWTVSKMESGETRVEVSRPAYLDLREPIRVLVTALLDGSAGSALEAPRVRPLAAAIAHETWIALVAPELRIVPGGAKGLGWVNARSAQLDPARSALPARDLGAPLAWSWLRRAASLQLDVEPDRAPPRVSLRTIVRLGRDRRYVDTFATFEGRSIPETLVFSARGELETSPVWSVGEDVDARPIEALEADRAAGASDADGVRRFRLAISRTGRLRGRIVLRASWVLTVDGAPSVPRLWPDVGIVTDSDLLVFADPSLTVEATAENLSRSERSAAVREAVAATLAGEPADRPGISDLVFASRFVEGVAPGELSVAQRPLEETGERAVILEATLGQLPSADGSRLERLTLDVLGMSGQSVLVDLSDNVTLSRLYRDSVPVMPVRAEGKLLLELPSPMPPRARCMFVLDTQRAVAGGGASGVEPAWPTFSVPCVSATWFVGRRDNAAIETTRPEGADRVTPYFWLGQVPRRLEALLDSRRRERAGRALMSAIEIGYRAVAPLDLTLGEVLTRLDAGDIPLVVDRWALDALGVSAESPLRAPVGDIEAAQSLEERLALLGLVARPVGRALVVTSMVSIVDRNLEGEFGEGALVDAVAAAARVGTDNRGRFCSVARWRGLSSSQRDLGATFDPIANSGVRYHTIERVGAESWSAIETRPTWPGRVLGWLSGILVVCVGATRLIPARVGRAWVILGAMLATGVAAVAAAPGIESAFFGTVAGALILLVHWLGRAIGRRVERPNSGVSARPLSALRRGAITTLVVAAGLSSLSFVEGRARQAPVPDARLGSAEVARPIVVLFPIEAGIEEGPDTRALMRLDDLERLIGLARDARAAAEASRESITRGFGAKEARHRIAKTEDGRLRVVSEYHLLGADPEGSQWSVPLGDSVDVLASVDGQPANLFVSAITETGRVTIRGPDPRFLQVSRTVPVGRGGLFPLEVASVAASRVTMLVEDEGTGERRPVTEVERWLGPVQRTMIGPSNRLEPPERPRANVSPLALWSAMATGDHLELRVGTSGPGELDRIGVELGEGWLVFPRDRTGGATRVSEIDGRPGAWTIEAVPALAAGEFLRVDFWRARAPANEGREESRPVPDPRLFDLDVVGGLFAVSTAEVGAVRGGGIEETEGDRSALGSFLERWKEPEAAPPAVDACWFWSDRPTGDWIVGRAPSRLTVQPTMQVGFRLGRLDVNAQALLTQQSNRPIGEVSIGVPPNLTVLEVEGAGLTGWARPAPERIVARFDQFEASSRTLRVRGWMTLDSDPEAGERREGQTDIPWFTWPGATVEAGLLTIAQAADLSVSVGEENGLRRLTAEETEGLGPILAAYRVERGGTPGAARWRGEDPGADVLVVSHLTVLADSADWIARARYRVRGGPCRKMRLEVPIEWARGMDVRIVGADGVTRLEREGERMIAEIDLTNPVWGDEEVEVRARRPLPEKTLEFPTLVPLGKGQAETYLIWTDDSGAGVSAEGSAGLQPIAPARIEQTEALGIDLERSRAYRAVRRGWSLAIRLPEQRVPSDGASSLARVEWCEMRVVAELNGGAVGMTTCELTDGTGTELVFRVADSCEVVSALVDGSPGRAFRDIGERVIVRLPNQRVRRVALIWTAKSEASGREARARLSVPVPEQRSVPLELWACVPEGHRVEVVGSGLEEVGGPRFATARLEGLLGGLTREVAVIDRSGARDRSQLLSRLIEYELSERWALRMLGGSGGRERGDEEAARAGIRERIEAARTQLEESVSGIGLDDFLTTARIRVGATEPNRRSRESETAELPLDFELPLHGESSWFLGSTGGGTPRLGVTAPPARSSRGIEWWLPWLWTGLTACVGLVACASRWERKSRAVLLTLVSAAALWAGGVSWFYVAAGAAILLVSALAERVPRRVRAA
jgi:hypothetical protein